MPSLTLEESNRICDAVIVKMGTLGVRVCISVVDSATNLIAMECMDGAIILAIEGSRGKAVASALYVKPSSELRGFGGSSCF